MTFTQTDKMKAIAITRIFETSKPFGDFSACVTLNDGAGVSYGICQFTHRSGALAAVVERYLRKGGRVGAAVLASYIAALKDSSAESIRRISANVQFRNALRSASVTSEMRSAQQEIAYELYLSPAISMCEKFDFVEPLSLAVVCDSLVHGSFYRVSRGVQAVMNDEREWIEAYVRRRHLWLASFPRLMATRYRTQFFLDQIAASNWGLTLPINVHGIRLSPEMIASRQSSSAVTPSQTGTVLREGLAFDQIGDAVIQAARRLDQMETAAETIVARADAAKSLWTAVLGTLWQALWGTIGWIAGLPIEIWVTVAVIAAVLAFLYLYRQIELGRIREGATALRARPQEK